MTSPVTAASWPTTAFPTSVRRVAKPVRRSSEGVSTAAAWAGGAGGAGGA